MDFMKLLKSLDDLVYEIVGWIIFYPITMVKTVLHPIAMLRYSDLELMEPDEDQYSDSLNPPIFLLITIFLAYLFDKVVQPHLILHVPAFLSSGPDLLLFRGIVFSIFPMMMAVDVLRHQGKPFDRNTLRPLFFGQCFIAAPFALVVSIAGQILEFHKLPFVLFALALYFIALIWYVAVEIIWFSLTLNVSKMRAAKNVLLIVVFTNIVVIAVALAISYLSKQGS